MLVVNGARATLMDQDGRVYALRLCIYSRTNAIHSIGSGKSSGQRLEEGSQLSVGGKELEIDRSVARHEYLSGECFGRAGGGAGPIASSSSTSLAKKFTPLRPLTINPGTTVRRPSTASAPPKSPVPVDIVGFKKEGQVAPQGARTRKKIKEG